MSRLMDAIRSIMGRPLPDPAQRQMTAREQTAVLDRLELQARRLKAMDAQVDAQLHSDVILHPRRRATDHR
jgi:hypothetical protein